MNCKVCGKKMKPCGTVDESWRFYKCTCGYESAKHIHTNKIKEVTCY